MPNLDPLRLLDHDAINYQELPDERLRALALEVEPFIATTALTELAVRRSAVSAETAWTVLTRVEEDRHLRTMALEILFNVSPDRAIPCMNDIGISDHDLRQAITGIVAEHPDSFADGPGATLARKLPQSSLTARVASGREAVVATRNRQH